MRPDASPGVLPGRVKNKAVNMVTAFIIKYIRQLAPARRDPEVPMAYMFVFGCFCVLGVAALLAAGVGYRGEVCDRSVGYEVPAEVKADPLLRKRASQLVAFWCTGAAVLSAAPLVPIGSVVLSGGGKSISTWGLAIFALYGMAVVIVGAYPFEKIKHLADD
ncbi:hypothetical protein Stsp02_76260 [Streptomyces sp. NBRC 14336]|uniref:hypothetical protein n=1 Tax=Streptomyces sp. NBRC 14336 TaxID=3030992 RepID=UPI0024A4AC5E|nr:hypothetical protein [Streptomyces sp. NBRC 14336]GLW51966.1 hypothetical protein Stsp02_76260 [Streptomyces sp. NBRC 14336]